MNTTDKIKVFLVDDDKLFVNALKHSLAKEKKDIEVKSFRTGEECIKNLNDSPSLVILDYNLNSIHPKAMNGMQVLRRIKHMLPDAEVIMLSSQNNINIAMNTIRNGAYDYITKSENSFIEIKNTVAHITSEIAFLKNAHRESKRSKLITLAVLLLLVLISLLGKFLS